MPKSTSLPKDMEKKAVEYIRSELKNGTSIYVIKRELVDKNYSNELAEKLLRKAQKRFPLSIILITLMIVVVAYGIYLLIPVISSMIGSMSIANCMDPTCFTTAANNCQSATFQNNIAGSIIKYDTKNCILTKTILKMNETEPQEMIDLFQGKSMTCTYTQDDFNTDLINSLTIGTDLCSGDLKDTIDLVTSV
jgi:hypothetical protein